ncbi:YVTN family beta-propeller protein [Arthrobacter globiformis]|uniref:YncE family protein n=1 Tax=Arthrobacter globiformis TaxID=1665 RepID=UPI002782FFD8|nr:YncE family protein [Arthrobacter globiformis]MDQ1060324.1 YVTN family beta-propeller protein [Arthrobacter globiformis]
MKYSWATFTAVLGTILCLGAAAAGAAPDEGTIDVYGTPVRVAIAADGTAYLGNYGQGGGIFVVPSGATTPSRTISTGGHVTTGLALGPDGTLYVATAEGDQSALGVIPAGAANVERTIPISPGLHALAAGPDGTVYVANPAGNTVSVIAPNGTAVDRTIAVGAGPAEIAVTTKDGTAFVTNQTAGSVSVIPAGADAVSKTIELVSDTGTSEQPHGIAAGPDGTVYVANIASNDIAVIKPGADAVADRIYVEGGPQDVAVARDGSVYVTSLLTQKLSVIRPHAKEAGGSIPTDAGPGHLAVAPDGSVIVISPGTSPGDGAVVRYSAAALVAASQGSTPAASGAPTAAAPAETAPEAAAQPSGGSWNALPAVAGGVAAVVVGVAVWILVNGRRRKAGLAAGTSRAD